MELIATATDLAAWMRTTFDTPDTAEATRKIRAAQVNLETRLGRPITIREFTSTLRAPRSSGSYPNGLYSPWDVHLPQTPVVSISSITTDEAPYVFSDERIEPWGISAYTGPLSSLGTIVVTYTAGIDGTAEEHADLKDTVLAAAARKMSVRADRTHGASRVSDEGFSVEYVLPSGYYTREELASLSRYRRRLMSA